MVTVIFNRVRSRNGKSLFGSSWLSFNFLNFKFDKSNPPRKSLVERIANVCCMKKGIAATEETRAERRGWRVRARKQCLTWANLYALRHRQTQTVSLPAVRLEGKVALLERGYGGFGRKHVQFSTLWWNPSKSEYLDGWNIHLLEQFQTCKCNLIIKLSNCYLNVSSEYLDKYLSWPTKKYLQNPSTKHLLFRFMFSESAESRRLFTAIFSLF